MSQSEPIRSSSKATRRTPYAKKNNKNFDRLTFDSIGTIMSFLGGPMKKSSRCKTPAKLSSSLHRQLNAYALTASAAGMGALVLPRAAQAKIIYTPADQSVPSIALDLNHDGIADFAITASVLNTTNGAGYAMQAYGLVGPNGIVQAHYGQPTYLAALHDGARIGANAFIFGGPMARTNVSNTNHQKHFLARGPTTARESRTAIWALSF